ncbi:TIGR02281 family clan AA aspartic protease [Singulisphaera sp. PoT]|uniref:TIGR02281 family clan AA aspartic protease n=1 Tax=Singulisphaera sp. PoT TaxID=3411797 RepID=UPI003BF57EF2
MTPRLLLKLSLAILPLLLLPGAPTLGADAPADSALLSKGLKRVGTNYVLTEEATIQKELNEARALYKQLTLAVQQQRALAQEAEENKYLFKEMIQRRTLLNQQLGQTSTVAEHNQIVTMLNDINDRMRLIHDEENDSKVKDESNVKAAQRREAFVQAVIDLRQRIDEAQNKYKELAEDAEVKDTLAALNTKTKAKIALGPSKTFLSNVKLVEKIEASVLTESVTMRRDNGVFWLDVTMNGKVTEPMVFDTGAGLTVLSSDLASKIGLKPSESDPTIECQIADGSIVEAKKMTIPSVRVGKFTIKDVECAVMPPSKKEISPLLGGSFNKYFDYKIVPDSGKLILSKVDTGEEPAAPKSSTPKSKATRTKARR